MGDIRVMDKRTNNGQQGGQTPRQLADTLRTRPDTLYRRFVRAYGKIPYAANMELSAEQIRVLSGKASKSKTVSIVTPVPKGRGAVRAGDDNKAKARLTFGLADFLAVAVYGHTALVWYEVAALFALPGVFAGVVVAALKHAAVTICRREKFTGLADNALAVAFVLDGLAWYAHYTIFVDALPERFAVQLGGGAFWTALVLGGVVAAGAFISLLLIRQITANKMWQ